MSVSSNDIVNEALQLSTANQPPIQGQAPTFDSSRAGQVAAAVYASVVQTVGRTFGWDFARRAVALNLSGNTPRLFAFEYLYPPEGIEIWELAPQPADDDPNDPLPINFDIANAVVLGTTVRVIQTDQPNAWAIYNNNPNENTWTAGFRQAVVRLLANYFTLALDGKPDLAQSMLEGYAALQQQAEGRRD